MKMTKHQAEAALHILEKAKKQLLKHKLKHLLTYPIGSAIDNIKQYIPKIKKEKEK